MNYLSNSSEESAAESGTVSGRLADSTVADLRVALARYMERPEGDDPELSRILMQIVTEGRSRHLRAEELVVIVKNVWDSLPDVRQAVDQEARTAAKQRLVTHCIKAYYAR